MSVFSLSSPKVVWVRAANRSKALTSRKEKDRAPPWTAAAIPSNGTPASSRLRTHRALRTSPGEKVAPVSGVRIPELTNRST